MKLYNAIEIGKNEIIRILTNKNDIIFEEIYNSFDTITYPHNIKSCLKECLWELNHLHKITFIDEEINSNTVIHLI